MVIGIGGVKAEYLLRASRPRTYLTMAAVSKSQAGHLFSAFVVIDVTSMMN
jgi:hypothetical protein